MQIVEKTPFDYFYATFLGLDYEIRKDILEAIAEECPPEFSMEEKLMILFHEVYCSAAAGPEWKDLFVQMGKYDKTLEFD